METLQDRLTAALWLRINLNTASTLFKHQWKVRMTPAGHEVPAFRASVIRTKGNKGSWPTPAANEYEHQDAERIHQRRAECKERTKNGNGFGLTLGQAVQVNLAGWPTPCQQDGPKGGPGQGDDRLPGAAQLAGWPTPTTPSGGQTPPEGTTATGQTPDGHKVQVTLKDVATLAGWPTPAVTNADRGGQVQRMKGRSNLQDAVMLAGWATPKAGEGTGRYSQVNGKRYPRLWGQAQLAASGETPSGSPAVTGSGGQLNPALPRWLQGLPMEWDLAAIEAFRLIQATRRKRGRCASKDTEMQSPSGSQLSSSPPTWNHENLNQNSDGKDSLINMIGHRFGKLIVLERNPENSKDKRVQWDCACDCGNSTVATGKDLRSGHRISCGCARLENAAAALRTHGMTDTPLYLVWRNMINRCEWKGSHNFHRYGGRGIKICVEWRNDAKAFIDWALANGYKDGLQIDRIDNDGNYEPSNCRFVTPSQNCMNRSRSGPSPLNSSEHISTSEIIEEETTVDEETKEVETPELVTHFVGDWGCLIHGEALATLQSMPSDSADALCTDPPGSINFMPATNSSWDSDKGGRENWVAWLTEIMRECLRVLKPGAYGVVWAHSTRSHWTALALEDAGFDIRECIFHLHAQGGAKCLNVAKAIDKQLGAEPIVIGPKPWKNQDIRGGSLIGGRDHEQLMDTAPATPEAEQWDGWYSGIKSSAEVWWLIQKPIAEKNIASNILKWGVGAVNVAATSVARTKDDEPGWHKSGANGSGGFQGEDTFRIREMSAEEIKARRAGKGRFSPNLILSHHELCVKVGTTQVKGCPQTVIQGGKDGGGYDVNSGDGSRHGVFEGYGDENGLETVDLWACVPGCAVRSLDIQGARGKRKEQATSRYYPNFSEPWFYAPKPGRSEKEAGLNHMEYATLHRVNSGGLEHEKRYAPIKVKNNHTTVKGLNLCKWLLSLVCPPDGLCIDPFAGSGTIGCAAGILGMRYLGIEQGNPPGCDRYVQIALGRMEYWAKQREES